MSSLEDAIVAPGERICVIEEFLPGLNSYSDESGYVRSLVFGRVVRDLRNHEVHVVPFSRRAQLKAGSIVYGKVCTVVNDRLAVVRVLALDDNNIVVPLKSPCTGLLHASQMSDSYVRSVYEFVGIGDIIRARIVSTWGPPYLLSIRSQDLGVISALCPSCMSEMRRRGGKLYCSACNVQVKRKVPLTY